MFTFLLIFKQNMQPKEKMIISSILWNWISMVRAACLIRNTCLLRVLFLLGVIFTSTNSQEVYAAKDPG